MLNDPVLQKLESTISGALLLAAKAQSDTAMMQIQTMLDTSFTKQIKDGIEVYSPININFQFQQGEFTTCADSAGAVETKFEMKNVSLNVPSLSMVEFNHQSFDNIELSLDLQKVFSNSDNESDDLLPHGQLNIQAGLMPLPAGIQTIIESLTNSNQPLK